MSKESVGVPPRPAATNRSPCPPLPAEGAARPPPPPLSEPAKVLLATLDHSGEEELALQLQDRMQFSKEAVACLVCVFDRLHSHINSLCRHVQEAGEEQVSERGGVAVYPTSEQWSARTVQCMQKHLTDIQ